MKAVCLFCMKDGCVNIHNYEINNCVIKDDMIEFFGYKIENHLKKDDLICKDCMKLMHNLAKLKRRLLPFIYRSETHYYKPLSFGKKWDMFASLSFDDDNDSLMRYRTPTPNNLLMCTKIEPYDSPLEHRIAEVERKRSLSRISTTTTECSINDNDKEVAEAFTKKRKKRGRKRGNGWTRKKKGRYSRAASTYTQMSSAATSRKNTPRSSRAVSAATNYSIESSDANSYYAKSITEVPVPSKIFTIFNCPLCNAIFSDLDVLTKHKIERHNKLALFCCYSCNTRYTTREDLNKHTKTHTEPYNCIICKNLFDSEGQLLAHWQNHFLESILCSMCGKRYLGRSGLKKHMNQIHFRKNIEKRIDYKQHSQKSIFYKDVNFQIRILPQSIEKT